MTLTRLLAHAPAFVRRFALHFECLAVDAVEDLANGLPPGARVLDAGAGEGTYRAHFSKHRYIGVDLAIGDTAWDYSKLDVRADLTALPLRAECIDAAIHMFTLEHLRDPEKALREIGRVLKRGATLLLAAPMEWEEHQQPHDYFRFTRHGLQLLLDRAEFECIAMRPAGGYFRLLSRRLLNGLQFCMRGWAWLLFVPAASILVPLSLAALLFEFLDREQNFTLGYLCIARKRS